MIYREYKQLDLPAIDREILDFWETGRIFEQSIETRSVDDAYVFYEGPPSANGMPGIHHVMARTVKDLFCRYHTLKGRRVERKGGWDTHGLPIELNVEKELGITKEDIGKTISVEEYNRKCRETVMRFKDKWDEITRKMGYWVDLEHPYITFDNDYIETVWFLLERMYSKEMLYKGYTIQPYSPAAGTGLSSHELNLPGCYKEVKDTTVVAMFEVIRDERSAPLFSEADEDLRILAWTTTPWTLPSNTALAVGKSINYLQVQTFNPYTEAPVTVILAADLLGNWFKPEGAEAAMAYSRNDKVLPYRILGTVPGGSLEGVRYTQLLPFVQPEDGDAFRVITGDFVSTEDGTGIVHIAPSFGADDMRVARANGIGSLTLVDRQGKFTDEAGEFAGRYVKDYRNEGAAFKDVDVDIAVRLKTEGRAFSVQKYVHNYPHCWRTDKPILYYPLDSWFVRASVARERMAELNRTINWKPAHTGTGRFGVWLDNLQDWNLSRSRYWGIPLPIWRTKDSTTEVCIGSVAQLRTAIEKANETLGLSQQVPPDLHRPYIDDIVLVSDSGEPMYREADLIDVWFDSGAMPYAQWHYPFENKEKFARSFPADFIAEGVDQTRGWFYTLHAIATICFDSIAFRNVVSNGLVLDKEGQKMSKSKGNVVDPFVTLAQYGADATRWYMMSNANPWDNLKFDPKGIEEVRNKFFGTLYNTYAFFALYANVDGFRINESSVLSLDQRPEIDRWVLSRLHTLVGQYREYMDDYEPTKACRAIEDFVGDHLSNWYVRLSRRRFWKGEMSADKQSAYETLYECLMVVTQLISPVAPFFADWMYRNLSDPVREHAVQINSPLRHPSVHISYLTQVGTDMIDRGLEERMDYAQRISSLALSLRKREKIRVRQPLQKLLLPVLDEAFIAQVDGVKDLILAEINVKELQYVTDTSGIIKKKAKPNFQTLGKRLGKHMKAAQEQIQAWDQEEIRHFESEGKITLLLESESFEFLEADILISSEDIPGWLVASDRELTVALDISISERLEAEGTARELVNRIQNMRKAADFNVTDRIRVEIENEPRITGAVAEFGDYVCSETLADSLTLVDQLDGGELSEIYEDLTLRLKVTRT